MKKVLTALTLALVIPVAAFAARDGHGPRDPGAKLERMAEALELDDIQKARMKALFEEHQAERKALREQMRTQMAEILNEDQRAKMKEMREERREQRKEERARHRKGDCGQEKSS